MRGLTAWGGPRCEAAACQVVVLLGWATTAEAEAADNPYIGDFTEGAEYEYEEDGG